MKNFRVVAWIVGIFTLSATLVVATNLHKDPSEPSVAVEEGIRFVDTNWASVLQKAKAEKKIIFLDAYASWCGPCKLLQKNVFPRPDVGAYFNKNFINVKVDMERGEGPQLARMYPLEAYPTLFFITPEGKVIRKVVGFQTAERLIEIGKGVKGE